MIAYKESTRIDVRLVPEDMPDLKKLVMRHQQTNALLEVMCLIIKQVLSDYVSPDLRERYKAIDAVYNNITDTVVNICMAALAASSHCSQIEVARNIEIWTQHWIQQNSSFGELSLDWSAFTSKRDLLSEILKRKKAKKRSLEYTEAEIFDLCDVVVKKLLFDAVETHKKDSPKVANALIEIFSIPHPPVPVVSAGAGTGCGAGRAPYSKEGQEKRKKKKEKRKKGKRK